MMKIKIAHRKIWPIRMITVILLVTCLQVSAMSYSQSISLTEKNVSLSKVFEEIHQQTGLNFLYNAEWLKGVPNLNIDVKNASIDEVMSACFKDLPFSYKIIENTIVVKQEEKQQNNKPAGKQEKVIVFGTVKTQNGMPLPGVNVVVKGTTRGASTDANGKYEISIEKSDKLLVFSSVGMKTVEQSVNGRTVIDVVMEEDVTTVSDVVVVSTGYQKISKERSAGSFVLLNNDQIKNKTSSMNVVDRLEGLAPGFAVNYSGGGEKYLLRGLSTINANKSLLVVVDGMPLNDMNSLTTLVNPNDVENISFLKDATSTSIWGALAANGVMVITTKKGKVSGDSRKIQISYNGFMSFKGQPDLDYFKMMNTQDMLTAAKEIFSPATYPWNVVSTATTSNSLPVIPPHEQILYDLSRGVISQTVANSRIDSLSRLNNRSQINQNLYQPSVLNNQNLNFTGGSEAYNYYGSFSYTGDKSANKNNLERYQMNIRQDFKFSEAVKLDLTTNLAYEKSKNFLLSDFPGSTSNILPYTMLADNSGNPLSMSYLLRHDPFRLSSEKQSGINLDYVPLNEPNYTKNKTTAFTARVNAGIAVKLYKGLTYEGRAQYQRNMSEGYEYYDQNSYKVRNERVFFTQPPATTGASPTYFLPVTGGHYNTKNITQIAWSIRNQLIFDNTFNKVHQLNALVGTEIRSNFANSLETYRRGYDFQTQTYALYDELSLSNTGVTNPVNYNSAATTNKLSSKPETVAESEIRYFSVYGNMAYSYNRKYTINSSVRMDQSNLFGTDKSAQYKPIWSLGGAWNIANEPFFHVQQINALKLRLTYGLAGNAPNPGQGGPYDILGAKSNTLYSGLGMSYGVIVPKNEKLSWERTSTTNVGLDFGLFKNRISGSVEVYKKLTNDLLGYVPIDPTTGYSFAYDNLGSMSNKGIEIQLNTSNVVVNDFSWKSILTVAYNENKITELKRMLPLTYSSKTSGNQIEGYSAFPLFGFNYIGLDKNGNPMALNATKDTVKLASQLKVDDPMYAGTTQPKWYGGLTNVFTYKGISLSCLIIYNLGHDMRRDVNDFYTGRLLRNYAEYFNDRWKKAGDEAITDIPGYLPSSTSTTQRMTALYTQSYNNIVSASYAKLRDVTLSYSLPKRVIDKLSMMELQVYGQVNNIMLWKNNKFDIDPEYFNPQLGTRTTRMPAFYTLGLRIAFK